MDGWKAIWAFSGTSLFSGLSHLQARKKNKLKEIQKIQKIDIAVMIKKNVIIEQVESAIKRHKKSQVARRFFSIL